jgi:hypothetical protein
VSSEEEEEEKKDGEGEEKERGMMDQCLRDRVTELS